MRGLLVETEFWNMDALFMPQLHPARDIHDVYFVKSLTHARSIAEPFATRVTEAHERGTGTGSTGWGYEFNIARQTISLEESGHRRVRTRWPESPSVPGKYFSIARCFRYDQDATHATDFFQVEGSCWGTASTSARSWDCSTCARPGSRPRQAEAVSSGLFPVYGTVGGDVCSASSSRWMSWAGPGCSARR
ncbi:MAG: hypothetical protein U0361_12070 [Nitrospiraceae bacterium]